MARASKRNLVLDTAETLFVRNGYAATGINQITQEAGIASMTLYNNFKNKNDLVIAVLARRDEAIFSAMDSTLEAAGPSPKEKMLAMFDYLAQHIADEAKANEGVYSGCAFNHAAAEFRDLSHPVHQMAVEHKQKIVQTIERLAKEAKHPDPEGLAQTLLLLVDGLLSTTQIMGDFTLASRARKAAELLINA